MVSGSFSGTVLDVLTQIATKTNAKVYADATVKSDMIQPVQIAATPMASALPMILKGTNYTFRRIEKPEEAWQVFRPINNAFNGDDLPRALQDISSAAGVPITVDDTVAGRAYADLQGLPLEVALETVLAGTSYVAKKEANYYVVADRKPESPGFVNISETRRVRLNYITPSGAKSLLSSAFAPYVQAETDPNSHMVTVTAPTKLAERLVRELKDMDIRPRHVLLDARIVAMERGDLLNIGVQWGMPTAQGGVMSNSWIRGTPATDTAIPAGNWPWGISVGLSFDQTFTNSLTAALNLLRENNKVDILSSPQIVGRDGKRSRIQAITEEYFALVPPLAQNAGLGFFSQTQFETVKSGTTLEITPLIGDNNDITLELAVEVSDSIPRGRGSDLPVVTRRTAQNSVVIRDGGTVAVAGLTENRTREKQSKVPWFGDLPLIGAAFRNNDNDKASREIAVFVTARLVPENSMTTTQLATPAAGGRMVLPPPGDAFQRDLKDELSRQ
jgi:type IV pilus assembly protein PilQ